MTIMREAKYPLKLMWIVPKTPNIYAFEAVVKRGTKAHQHIHDTFVSAGADVLYEFHSRIDEDKDFIFIAVMGVGLDVSIDELLANIRKRQDLVIDIKRAAESGKFYFADMMFPITLAGARAIIFDNASLMGLIMQFRRNFGEEGATQMLFHIGQAIGESIYSNYIKFRGYDSKTIKEAIDNMNPILHSIGWGYVSNTEIRRDYIRIYIGDYWECALMKETGATRPTGSIMRGILSTIFERLHGRRVSVTEVECINTGSEYCVFEVRPLTGEFRAELTGVE